MTSLSLENKQNNRCVHFKLKLQIHSFSKQNTSDEDAKKLKIQKQVIYIYSKAQL